MRSGGVGRTARRAVAVAVLGALAVLTGSVLSAPVAGAAPTATVEVRDLTPPLVSIDPGGTVTFVNLVQDKTVQVGGGGLLPSLVTVVVHTDVALTLPSGQHPLKPGESWAERFDRSCLVGCAITYTYRAEVPGSSVVGSLLSTVTGKALATLPQSQVVGYDGQQTTVTLGVPTPFLVNTIVPLPNLPSVDLPQLPAVTVPVPGAPVPGVPAPELPATEQPAGGGTEQPAAVLPPPVGGTGYAYGTPSGAAQLSPTSAAGTAFDPSRLGVPGSVAGAGPASASGGSGSGGLAGGPDGSGAPTYGALAGLGNPLDESGEDVSVASDDAALPAPGLSVPALLAVIALAGTSSALVKVRRARRP
ncbi:hypothetical protein FHX36_003116 [Modestobacter versicolor]|uniref:Gram-positive cocci surface proteins LPxTG domain-containing protein n=2 Tax=Modestobacter versicolor TaxID=429133 RepID=A0A839Y8X0_9ACTN|nr:hypothetical protein [Modestobacter versicolor]MBB3677381.1 hypothetical protein [Modestobacter versicolor]